MSLTYSPKIVTEGLVVCLDPNQNTSLPTYNLPVKDSLILWLDAADDSSFNYSSGTSVAQWRDKSPSGFHVSQSTAANQPTRNTFQNSRKTVSFDGTNDSLSSASILNLSNGYTAFVVVKSSATGERDILTSNPYAQSTDLYLYQQAASGKFGNWASTYTTSAISTSTWYVFSTAINSSGSETVYLNGTTQNTGSRTLTNTKSFTVGAYNAGTGEFWSGEMAEIILFNRQLSATELKKVHTYLGLKWGISNTDRTVFDLSGNNNHASFGSGTTSQMPFVDYYNKNSFQFDGVNDYLYVNSPGTFAVYSFMFWCRWISDTAFGSRIFGIDNFGTFTIFTPSNVAFHYNQAAGTTTVLSSGANIGLDNWCHVAVTVDGTYAKIYINGGLANATTAIPYISVSGGFFIGAQSSSSVLSNSNVSSFLFYNRSLTAAEILQNYNVNKFKFVNTIVKQGLVLNLDAGNPFSYGGGGIVWYDTSGNGLNASAAGNINYRNLYGGAFSVYPSVNSYFNTATVSALNLGSASFSIEAWVYFDDSVASDNVYRGVMSLGTDSSNYVYISKWRSGLYSGLYVQYIAGGATVTGVYQSNDYDPVSRWTHVVATKSSNVLYLYINGVLYSTASNLNTTFTGNSYIIIANAHAGVGTLNGYVAQTRVYNISLSAAQVLQNYNATRSTFGL